MFDLLANHPQVGVSFHCKLIQICCNTNRTLLQLSSNNHNVLTRDRAVLPCRIAV